MTFPQTLIDMFLNILIQSRFFFESAQLCLKCIHLDYQYGVAESSSKKKIISTPRTALLIRTVHQPLCDRRCVFKHKFQRRPKANTI